MRGVLRLFSVGGHESRVRLDEILLRDNAEHSPRILGIHDDDAPDTVALDQIEREA